MTVFWHFIRQFESVTMCLELSVIRNIRPSMPCCTDSTGTPSFPANKNHYEFRTFNVETECFRLEILFETAWICLNLTA